MRIRTSFAGVCAVVTAVFLVISGCAVMGSKGGYDGVSGSYPGATVPIAEDAARLVAGFYPPGHTSLRVDAGTEFGRAFEAALRKRGFTLSESGTPISYQLDMLEPGVCYLSLRTPGNQVISQSYALSGGGVASESPITTTGSGSFVEPLAPTALTVPPSFVETDIPSTAAASVPASSRTTQEQSNQGGLKLALAAPPADTLKSGISCDVTLVAMQGGAVMPGAGVRFRKSAAYPNLRTLHRTADEQGRVTLRGLAINDINTPLRATVNGQDVELYLKGAPAQAKPSPAAAVLPPPQIAANHTPKNNEFSAVLSEIDKEKPREPVAQSAQASTVLAPPAPAAPKDGSFVESELSEASASAQPVRIDQTWTIRPGLLREQLIGWANRAGYQVVWKASSDFDIFTAASFQGGFETAVDQLFQRLYAHGNSLRVEIYKANKVIEINED